MNTLSLEEVEVLLDENERLRGRVDELAEQLARMGGQDTSVPCWPCEIKRRWFGVLLGAFCAAAWTLCAFVMSHNAWISWVRAANNRTDNHWTLLDAVTYLAAYLLAQSWFDEYALKVFWPIFAVLIGVPVLTVVLSWHADKFERNQTWKRWRIYRAWQHYKRASDEGES